MNGNVSTYVQNFEKWDFHISHFSWIIKLIFGTAGLKLSEWLTVSTIQNVRISFWQIFTEKQVYFLNNYVPTFSVGSSKKKKKSKFPSENLPKMRSWRFSKPPWFSVISYEMIFFENIFQLFTIRTHLCSGSEIRWKIGCAFRIKKRKNFTFIILKTWP